MKLVQRCRSDGFMQSESEQESVCDNCNMFRRSAPFARSVKVLKQPCSLYTGGGGGIHRCYLFYNAGTTYSVVCIVHSRSCFPPTVTVTTTGGNNSSRLR